MLNSIKRIFADVRLVRMSDGHFALVRQLGLVKGGRGLRLHEKILSFNLASSSRNRNEVPDHAFHTSEATAAIPRP